MARMISLTEEERKLADLIKKAEQMCSAEDEDDDTFQKAKAIVGVRVKQSTARKVEARKRMMDILNEFKGVLPENLRAELECTEQEYLAHIKAGVSPKKASKRIKDIGRLIEFDSLTKNELEVLAQKAKQFFIAKDEAMKAEIDSMIAKTRVGVVEVEERLEKAYAILTDTKDDLTKKVEQKHSAKDEAMKVEADLMIMDAAARVTEADVKVGMLKLKMVAAINESNVMLLENLIRKSLENNIPIKTISDLVHVPIKEIKKIKKSMPTQISQEG